MPVRRRRQPLRRRARCTPSTTSATPSAVGGHVPVLAFDARSRESTKQMLVAVLERALERALLRTV